MIADVRLLNRMEFVAETLRAALEALPAAAPDWLEQTMAERETDWHTHAAAVTAPQPPPSPDTTSPPPPSTSSASTPGDKATAPKPRAPPTRADSSSTPRK
ncbi:hypothetical protein C4B68_38605 [Streptomyces dengpaensis]|uniref:Uncharacterized protein n=1 Tax=Streptomyces dengpaensis TaxID=2049881 RepID=A0ABN5IBY4_9ACTN|nr:hypothetical protein C4B68_38605 [Streptomyces dengpaensis]PIB03609.1 hypothetical protein B1C81_36500 [Streptomyces sp. HG99]